jgi:serine protease AprX
VWNSATTRVVYSKSWINDGLGGLDGDGHGTHVAGIIAGNGYSSTGTQYNQTFKGLAPNANIVNLRVLDSTGAGTVSNVIDAIQTAVQLKSKYNIRVINLSLGTPVMESYTLDPLCQAVEAAWKAGIVVVVSAGNEGRNNTANTNGYGTISSPGNDPYVITVGAMKTMGTPSRDDDQIASYSSKGPTSVDHIAKPDLVAPGNRTISALGGADYYSASYPDNKVPLSFYEPNAPSVSATAATPVATATVSANLTSNT